MSRMQSSDPTSPIWNEVIKVCLSVESELTTPKFERYLRRMRKFDAEISPKNKKRKHL